MAREEMNPKYWACTSTAGTSGSPTLWPKRQALSGKGKSGLNVANRIPSVLPGSIPAFSIARSEARKAKISCSPHRPRVSAPFDAGSPANPLVARVEHPGEVVVGQNSIRHIESCANDADSRHVALRWVGTIKIPATWSGPRNRFSVPITDSGLWTPADTLAGFCRGEGNGRTRKRPSGRGRG